MVLSFLIATLVVFSFGLISSVFLIGVNLSNENWKIGPSIINICISLVMITWNIFAIISL